MRIIEEIANSLRIKFEDQDTVDAIGEINLQEFNLILYANINLAPKITLHVTYNKIANPELSFTPQMQEQLFLTLNNLNQTWLHDLAFQHYIDKINSTSYGTRTTNLLAKHGGNQELANQEVFGIHTTEDVIKAMQLTQINIAQDQENLQDIFSSLRFEIPWDDEHGLVYEFKNIEFLFIE